MYMGLFTYYMIEGGREGRGRAVVRCLSLLEKMAKNCMKMITRGGSGGGGVGSKLGQKVIT